MKSCTNPALPSVRLPPPIGAAAEPFNPAKSSVPASTRTPPLKPLLLVIASVPNPRFTKLEVESAPST